MSKYVSSIECLLNMMTCAWQPLDCENDINSNPIIGYMVGQIPVTKCEFFNVWHEVVDNRMPASC